MELWQQDKTAKYWGTTAFEKPNSNYIQKVFVYVIIFERGNLKYERW